MHFEIYQTANGGWCAGYYAGTDRNRKVHPLACGLADGKAVENRLKELYPNQPVFVEVPQPGGSSICVLGLADMVVTDKMLVDWKEDCHGRDIEIVVMKLRDAYEVTYGKMEATLLDGPFRGASMREALARAYIDFLAKMG